MEKHIITIADSIEDGIREAQIFLIKEMFHLQKRLIIFFLKASACGLKKNQQCLTKNLKTGLNTGWPTYIKLILSAFRTAWKNGRGDILQSFPLASQTNFSRHPWSREISRRS